MVECIGDKGPLRSKGEIGNEVTYNQHAGPRNGNKGQYKHKWGHGKLGLHINMEKSWGKELATRKVKWNLTKVKCFNYDNHGHLVKDYPKPLQVCDYITKVK